MRNWVFDIQRFAALSISEATVTGLTSGNSNYYALTINGSSATVSTTAITGAVTYANGTFYLRVNNNAGNYELSIVKGDGTTTAPTTAASEHTLNSITTLNFTSGATGTTLDSTIPSTVKLTTTGTAEHTISWGGLTVVTASNAQKSATIVKSGSTYTAEIDSTTGAAIQWSATYGSEKVYAYTGSATVSSDGKVTGISNDAVLHIGTSTAANLATTTDPAATATTHVVYTVTDGLRMTAKYWDTSLATAAVTTDTYLLTSKIDNLVIAEKDGVNGADDITGASKATVLSLGVGGTAIANAAYGIDTSNGQAFVYAKNGNYYISGYADSSIGTQVGVITSDGSGNFTYNGASSSQAIALTNVLNAVVTGYATDSNVVKVTTGSANDTINFTTATKAVTIDGGSGKDTITIKAYDTTSVTGGAGNDTINVVAPNASAGAFIGGGEGNDSIKASADFGVTTSAWTVSGGAGDDTLDFSSVVTGTGTEWLVDGGDGNNAVSVGAGIRYSTIKGGSGNDTIRVVGTSAATAATNTVTGGSGNNVFDISVANTGANITDYTFGNDSLLVTAATDAAVNTVAQTTTDLTTEGVITDGVGAATLTSSGGFYAATLIDANRNKVNLAWTKDDATSIDASSIGVKSVLVGTRNSEGDLLVGSAKADTLYAGASDSVYGGAGADAISIGASAYGVYVGVATDSGADTVADFNVGFDIDSADAVYMVNGSVEDATISNDGANVTVKSGKGSLELTGKGSNSTSGVKLLVGDKKVYSIAEGVQLAISDSEDLADYFYGTKSAANGSGIDLSNYADDVSVDLSSSMFKNIASVTGGKGNTTLMGSSTAETLFGGTGATSLYGGAGKDSLVSGAGVTTFFLTTGAGKDSVYGFVTGTNEDSSDVLNIFNAGLTGISRSSDSVFTLKVSDTDSLQVAQSTSGVDQKIQYASGSAKGVAKIGYNSAANSFSYDEEVTNYLGGSKNDTLAFGSGSDDVNVWLDQTSVYSSIETFDASSRSGSVLLAGTAASETLKGGTGESSLWGGAGSASDVLVGSSSGATSFFYGMGQGSDSISGNSNSTMNLYDINLSDLTDATLDTSNRRVIFTTTAGDTVSVSGGVQDFVVGGVTYRTTYASSTDWSVKE